MINRDTLDEIQEMNMTYLLLAKQLLSCSGHLEITMGVACRIGIRRSSQDTGAAGMVDVVITDPVAAGSSDTRFMRISVSRP